MRFGPPPRIMTFFLPDSSRRLVLVARRSSSSTACRPRTRRRRCRRAGRSATTPQFLRSRADVGFGDVPRGARAGGRRSRAASRFASIEFRRSTSVQRCRGLRASSSISTICSMLSQEPRSIFVSSKISSTRQARLQARSARKKIRSAFGVASFGRSRRGRRRRRRPSGSLPSPPRPKRPISRPRSAFCSDSLNVRPIAIASPTRLHLRGQRRRRRRGISRR